MRIVFVLFALSLVGCVGPQAMLKKETPHGGRVQVVGLAPEIRSPAAFQSIEQVIGQKCPKGYEELERGEELSGSTVALSPGAQLALNAFYIDFKCK